jgi:protein-tyrosine phosphatase
MPSPFRPVALPARFPGRLFLTNMPGYWRPAEVHAGFWQQLIEGGAEGWVVCLAGEAERKRKSPDYPRFLEAAKLGGRWIEFPIRDRSVPEDLAALLALLDRLIELLQIQGAVLAIHCAAGVGRTGTVAACLLLRLGMPAEAAVEIIEAAGSGPETARQLALVREIQSLTSD